MSKNLIPMDAITTILNDVMSQAVSNGANSILMPDDYVRVAHFLSFQNEYEIKTKENNMSTLPLINCMPLAKVCAYVLPDGAKIEEVLQMKGESLWAVRQGGNCLSKECEWEYEPMPSSRDEEFFARCRWASAELAYEAWLRMPK